MSIWYITACTSHLAFASRRRSSYTFLCARGTFWCCYIVLVFFSFFFQQEGHGGGWGGLRFSPSLRTGYRYNQRQTSVIIAVTPECYLFIYFLSRIHCQPTDTPTVADPARCQLRKIERPRREHINYGITMPYTQRNHWHKKLSETDGGGFSMTETGITEPNQPDATEHSTTIALARTHNQPASNHAYRKTRIQPFMAFAGPGRSVQLRHAAERSIAGEHR